MSVCLAWGFYKVIQDTASTGPFTQIFSWNSVNYRKERLEIEKCLDRKGKIGFKRQNCEWLIGQIHLNLRKVFGLILLTQKAHFGGSRQDAAGWILQWFLMVSSCLLVKQCPFSFNLCFLKNSVWNVLVTVSLILEGFFFPWILICLIPKFCLWMLRGIELYWPHRISSNFALKVIPDNQGTLIYCSRVCGAPRTIAWLSGQQPGHTCHLFFTLTPNSPEGFIFAGGGKVMRPAFPQTGPSIEKEQLGLWTVRLISPCSLEAASALWLELEELPLSREFALILKTSTETTWLHRASPRASLPCLLFTVQALQWDCLGLPLEVRAPRVHRLSPIRAPRPPPSSHRRPFSRADGRGGGRVWAPEHRPPAWGSVPSPAPLRTCLQCIGHVKVDPGLLAFPVTQNEHWTGAGTEQAATWGGSTGASWLQGTALPLGSGFLATPVASLLVNSSRTL